jgi:hypothetical protein
VVIGELKKAAAYLCLLECRPEDEVHTDDCKTRRLEFERARKIARETLDEVQAALAAGEGLQSVRDRLLSI